MSISKRALLASSAGLVIALSTAAIAQTAKGNAKSQEVATVGEGEAVMLGPKGQRLHKSKVKVTAAQHEAAMKKGAREVKPGTVLYKQGGKMYMIEDSANEKASTHFQSQFRHRLLIRDFALGGWTSAIEGERHRQLAARFCLRLDHWTRALATFL